MLCYWALAEAHTEPWLDPWPQRATPTKRWTWQSLRGADVSHTLMTWQCLSNLLLSKRSCVKNPWLFYLGLHHVTFVFASPQLLLFCYSLFLDRNRLLLLHFLFEILPWRSSNLSNPLWKQLGHWWLSEEHVFQVRFHLCLRTYNPLVAQHTKYTNCVRYVTASQSFRFGSVLVSALAHAHNKPHAQTHVSLSHTHTAQDPT